MCIHVTALLIFALCLDTRVVDQADDFLMQTYGRKVSPE